MPKKIDKAPVIKVEIQQPAPKTAIQPIRIEATEAKGLHQQVEIPDNHAMIVPIKNGLPDYSKSSFYALNSVDKRYGNKPEWLIIKGRQTIIENTRIYENLSRESKRVAQKTGGNCRSCGG